MSDTVQKQIDTELRRLHYTITGIGAVVVCELAIVAVLLLALLVHGA